MFWLRRKIFSVTHSYLGTWLPLEQFDMVTCCLQLRLPKNISRREEKAAKVVTGHDEVVLQAK